VQDDHLISLARAARIAMETAEHETRKKRGDYHAAIGALAHGGMTVREIGRALGLSHQRVQQILAELACSFCGLAADAVARLVVGAGRQPTWKPGEPRKAAVSVYICDRCIVRAARTVRRGEELDEDGVLMTLASHASTEPCDFCGCRLGERTGLRARCESIVACDDARICRHCIAMASNIIETEWKQQKRALK